MPDLPPLRLTGAEVLLPDGFAREALSLADGRIAAGGGRDLDLTGCRILPGIIDLHGDGFERHMAPRRGAVENPAMGLAALDAECGACGITTAMLAQFWSWEGGMRGPAFAAALAEALDAAETLTDMALQLRVESPYARHTGRDARLGGPPCHQLCRLERPPAATANWPQASARRV